MTERTPGAAALDPTIRRITLDPRRNTLRLVLAERPTAARRVIPALIDIGEGGRLLGIELGDITDSTGNPLYLSLFPATSVHVRSVPASVYEDLDASGDLLAVEVPRRGDGYEIAYPSGNQ